MAEKNKFRLKTRFKFTKKIGPSKLYLMFPSNLVNKVKSWHKDVSSRGGLIGIFLKKQLDKAISSKLDKGHPAYQYFSNQEKEIAEEPLNYIPASSEWIIIKRVKLVNAQKQEPNKKGESLVDFSKDDDQSSNTDLSDVKDMKGSKLYTLPQSSSIEPDAVVAVCYTHNVKGNLGSGSGIDITDMPDWMDKAISKVDQGIDTDGDNRYNRETFNKDFDNIMNDVIEINLEIHNGNEKKNVKVSYTKAVIKKKLIDVYNQVNSKDPKLSLNFTGMREKLDLDKSYPDSMSVDITPILNAIKVSAAGDFKTEVSASQTLFFLKSLNALESNGVIQILSQGNTSIPPAKVEVFKAETTIDSLDAIMKIK